MALELLGSFFVALTLGLLVWALRKRFAAVPGWATPVAAGVGLIGTAIWMEYSWFDRVSGALPAQFQVTNAETTASPLRPWTYVAPLVSRFTALDGSKLGRHPERSELIVAPVFGFARWENPQSALMVFDCAAGRRVPLTEGMAIDASGTLTGAEWLVLENPDGLQLAACKEG
ncbi:hypothetical protein [Tabrizicola sp.]|uniref:hypothetical protein n=1 Tax=Tabrizicola sp. TaxID=2005166 RepID=UPI0027350580|nr:hypothetical protein [Tabrizicola sp.]MDP3196033.1 hypothetical protein [Tabrizicola sp.]